MAVVAFTKVEGLGNDFILLDRMAVDAAALADELARLQAIAPRVCDRRTGIGADGILVVGPARGEAVAPPGEAVAPPGEAVAPPGEAVASMTVVNFDGSRPEMCGNGLRCVAAFVADLLGLTSVCIDTDAGPKRCEVTRRADGIEVDVDMGPARELGVASPSAGEGRAFVGISMGNPHAVHFVGDDERPEALARSLGPGVELDDVYAPAKTNVEFARIRAGASGPEIELWVWERGVGITSACGTGACATAVAAVGAGLVERGTPVAVQLPGGRLTITVPEDPGAGVSMRGPCRRVFLGSFERADFE